MKHNYIDHVLLSIIFLFHSLLNIYFIFRDTTPPEWDPSIHGVLSLLYFRGSDIVFTANYYPPFFHLSMTPLYALFGTSFDVACCVNILFLGILLFSIYGIGKTLFNREAGLISALFISFIPMLINLQRDLFIDFALISMISLSIFLLLKTQNFKNTNYSILFGIVAGLTILTKWTMIFFLAAPVIWTLYQSIKNSDLSKPVKCNICGSSILFLLITYAWYIPNYAVVYYLLKGQAHWGAVEGDPAIFSLSSFFYYFNAVNVQVYLIISVLALLSVIILLLKIDKDKKILFILSLLIPYIIFTLTRNKDIRYMLPLLIFLALAVGFTLANINSKKVKTAIIFGFIVFGLMQTSTVTFGVPSFDTPSYLYPESNHPKQSNWKVDEIFDTVFSDSNNSQQTKILMLYSEQHMNHWTLKYCAFLNNLSVLIHSNAILDEDRTNIYNYDFVLCSKIDISDEHPYERKGEKNKFVYISIINEFNLKRIIDIPNYGEMYIYDRK